MNNYNIESQLVISYLTLRKAIGIIGVSLPVILFAGHYFFGDYTGMKPSISLYYDSNMGDVFVGVLFVLGIFLFSYRGYEKIDNLAGNLGCLFALGVALFPASLPNPVRAIHLVFAGLLFLTLAYFSIVLFTKSSPTNPLTPQKLKRNVLYKTCGYVILGCIGLLILYFAFQLNLNKTIADLKPIFWLETIMLWAFGISWLTKGKVLLADIETLQPDVTTLT